MPTASCVLLLSDKSSGSSILQRELSKHPAIQLVRATPHQENETLYWNKATALLGLHQSFMMDSHILPMTTSVARQGLVELCTANVPGYIPPEDDRELVFDGWRRLCHEFRPVFLEKSPHHLHYWSALELMLEADSRLDDVSFFYLGLVRNPIDTLYSMWSRWRVPPEQRQHEWLRAYQNLRLLQRRVPDRTLVVRYEDLVGDPISTTKEICRAIGVEWQPDIGANLHQTSLRAWSEDPYFGFRPTEEVIRMAHAFGYPASDLDGRPRPLWPLRRAVGVAARRLRRIGGRLKRRLFRQVQRRHEKVGD